MIYDIGAFGLIVLAVAAMTVLGALGAAVEDGTKW